MTYDPSGRLSEHAETHARAWSEQGFAVVLVANLDDIDNFSSSEDLLFCDGILLRANLGYDFGAWATAIRELPELAQAMMLVIANDSVYGPFSTFPALIERARSLPAEVVGVVESGEIKRHLQSFMIFFKGSVVSSATFRNFWKKVTVGDRQHAIDQYELNLADRFSRAGISVGAIFPFDRNEAYSNPTLANWKHLVEAGFPFLKTQLLRENPFGADISNWEEIVRSHGYDPAIAKRQLARGP